MTYTYYLALRETTKEEISKHLIERFHFHLVEENQAIESTFGHWEGYWVAHEGKYYAFLMRQV